jgi:hypothetical protein
MSDFFAAAVAGSAALLDAHREADSWAAMVERPSVDECACADLRARGTSCVCEWCACGERRWPHGKPDEGHSCDASMVAGCGRR